MTDHKQQLTAAMHAFNEAERTEFCTTNNVTWLGLDGPTYLIGDARAHALCTGPDGRHWIDGALYVESLSGLANNPGLMEAYRQAIATDASDDLWVFTDTRGRWNAIMAPVDYVAFVCGYPAPAPLPPCNWARTWWDMPERTDAQELAWIAHGGTPTSSYRVGGQR